MLGAEAKTTELLEAVESAAEWLVRRQQGDGSERGSWGEAAPWLTGRTMFALGKMKSAFPDVAPRNLQVVIERGGDFLERVQDRKSGAWDEELGTWDTAWCVLGLQAAGGSHRDAIQRGRQFLIEHFVQHYPGHQASYGDSYAALVARCLAETGDASDLERASLLLQTVASHQKQGYWDDEFGTSEILIAARDVKTQGGHLPTDWNQRAAAALDWLKARQSETAIWGTLTWTHAMCTQAYAEWANELRIDPNPANEAVRWLLDMQHSNGSWWHLPDHTAYSLEALTAASTDSRQVPQSRRRH